MDNSNDSEEHSFLERRRRSFGFAFIGIGTFFSETVHARIHLVLGGCTVVAGFLLDVSRSDWLVLVFCIGWVMSLEAVNSALEYLTDLSSPKIHPLAKKAKDVAAGAVLIAAITSAILGFIIFVPRVLERWG